MLTPFAQWKTLSRHYLLLEFKRLDRIFSSFLFALTFLLIFMLAMGQVEPAQVIQIYLAEAFLAGFFALQLSFARSLEADKEDGVFEVLKTLPLAPSSWFLAKFSSVFCTGAALFIPTLAIASLFHNGTQTGLFTWPMVLICILALLGLTALGVLLSMLTLGARAKQILYPILYFPLTIPVLLCALEASRALLLKTQTFSDLWGSWLGLLGIFDVVYITLSILLFAELIKPE